uniref:Nucelotide kinase n=1 Tax=Dulem virus 36 TaxID=3145754 RepID=A0AAU8AYM9_9CAUD
MLTSEAIEILREATDEEFLKSLRKDSSDKEHKTDNVNKPVHYTQTSLECFDAMLITFGVDAMMQFCVTNAYKYLWRHKNKGGKEDLEKANWYLKECMKLSEMFDTYVPDHYAELECMVRKYMGD